MSDHWYTGIGTARHWYTAINCCAKRAARKISLPYSSNGLKMVACS